LMNALPSYLKGFQAHCADAKGFISKTAEPSFSS